MATNKYKSDIAESAANMMQLPDTLEGMLQDVHGQKEVESPIEPKGDVSVPETTPTVEKKAKKQKLTKPNPVGAIPLIDGDALWASFSSLCEQEELLPKTVGKDGNASFCKVDKDILATFRKYSVGGYNTQTLVNAILRSFILYYKKEFNKYKITEKSLL
ncbi:MAG: hypothetical protein ACTTKN_11255 [Phocaeicola sp.]|uniref:hypothetical protein n=1 Tax=Phocaeicola sp. TaxID=2773926 RepID=UPI003FA187E7